MGPISPITIIANIIIISIIILVILIIIIIYCKKYFPFNFCKEYLVFTPAKSPNKSLNTLEAETFFLPQDSRFLLHIFCCKRYLMICFLVRCSLSRSAIRSAAALEGAAAMILPVGCLASTCFIASTIVIVFPAAMMIQIVRTRKMSDDYVA